jgi:hypothetical protein
MLPRPGPALAVQPNYSQISLWTERMKQDQENRVAQEATVKGMLDEYETMLLEMQREHAVAMKAQEIGYKQVVNERDDWETMALELRQSLVSLEAKEQQLNKQHAGDLQAREQNFAQAMQKRDEVESRMLQQHRSREAAQTSEIEALQEQARMNELETMEVERDFVDSIKIKEQAFAYAMQQSKGQIEALEKQVKQQMHELEKAEETFVLSMETTNADHSHELEEQTRNHVFEAAEVHKKLQEQEHLFAQAEEELKQEHSEATKQQREKHANDLDREACAKLQALQQQKVCHMDTVDQLTKRFTHNVEALEQKHERKLQQRNRELANAIEHQEDLHADIMAAMLARKSFEQEQARRSSIRVPAPWEGMVKHLGGEACRVLMSRL